MARSECHMIPEDIVKEGSTMLSRSKKRTAAVFFAVILAATLGADEKTDKVDNVFAPWDRTTSPGAAIAVIRDGKTVYMRGYGMAKIEDGILVKTNSVFDIGSVSKQFTAACVAMLIQDGKLSLDDDVRKYISEFPRYPQPVKIRHLIHHTSGVKDYIALLVFAGFLPETDSPTAQETLDIICRQKHLNFAPGEQYSYSNSGYFLLSQIVERISGKSLKDFAQERIFGPLGMQHTFFQDDHSRIVPNRASGYDPQPDGGYKFNMSRWSQTGDGAVYTTVEDLVLWDEAFRTYALGRDFMAGLLTMDPLNDGAKNNYAFGLFVGEHKGLKTISHGGAWAGYRSAFVRFPEKNLTVICLSNLSTMDATAMSYKVADIYLEAFLKKTNQEINKEYKSIDLPASDLMDKTGSYLDSKYNSWVSLSLQNGVLKFSGLELEFALMPIAEKVFAAVDAPLDIALEFLPQVQGQPLTASLKVSGEEILRLLKTIPFSPPSPERLREYVGDYQSDELLNARYRIVLDKGNLFVVSRYSSQEPLRATSPDQFCLDSFAFKFFRKNGKIAGFTLNTVGATNIVFIKN